MRTVQSIASVSSDNCCCLHVLLPHLQQSSANNVLASCSVLLVECTATCCVHVHAVSMRSLYGACQADAAVFSKTTAVAESFSCRRPSKACCHGYSSLDAPLLVGLTSITTAFMCFMSRVLAVLLFVQRCSSDLAAGVLYCSKQHA
eukprot:14446-Heterococcus_DN1.PRE.8